MDIHDYSKTLLQFKGRSLSLLKYLGARWIVMKIVLCAFGTAATFCPHMTVKCLGIFVLGYTLGVAVADIRSHLLGKRKWALQQELYDWDKIESLAKEQDEGTNT